MSKINQMLKPATTSSIVLALSLLPVGCGKGSDDAAGLSNTVENDQAVLAQRLDTTRTEIPLNAAPDLQLGYGLLDTFTAVQVAGLVAPTVGGQKIQANSLAVNGTAVYIGYNTAGDAYNGGIDVLDVSNVLSLQLLSSLSLPGIDVSGLTKQGTNLYAVGASGTTEQAFLDRIALNGSLLSSTITQVALPGHTGTDITSNGTSLFAASGDNAGLTVFDLASLTQTKTTAITDARAVGLTPAGLPMVLSGQPGRISTMTAAGDLSSTVSLGGAATAQSKSSLKVGSLWSVASLGEGGFTVLCNADGSTVAHQAAITLTGVDPALTVTNAVTSSNGLVYAANGQAGVYVYAVRSTANGTACGAGSLSLLGTLNFGTDFSPNGVYSNGAFLYVAGGLGGLKIITTVFTTLSPVTTNL